MCSSATFNTLELRQSGRHSSFPDDIFKRIVFTENVDILITIWPKFVPKGPTDNDKWLIQIMAWHLTGDKPVCGPMMASVGDAYVRLSASMCQIVPLIY